MSDHDHPVDPDQVVAVRTHALSAAEAQPLAGLVTVLGDPLRARIASALLITDEVCVGDLALALDASEDAVSYALRILRTAGLVERRRQGRLGYYRLGDGDARDAIRAALDQLRRLTHLQPDAAADHATGYPVASPDGHR